MSKHRALLIGVPKYGSKTIPSLPFIENDIIKLREALNSAGYQVQSIGIKTSEKNVQATPGVIRGCVYEFCSKAEKDETLLLCFSGHGVHFNGNDYLVPCDARIEDPNIESYLIPLTEFSKSFESSKAEAIIFFVDACREGITLGTMGIVPFKLWGTQKLQLSKERDTAFVFSCSPGELSRFISGPDTFSLFSRALAETISVDNPAANFNEVIAELQKRLNQLADKNGKPRQTIRTIYESSPGDKRLIDRVLFDKTSKIRIKNELRRRADERADEIKALLWELYYERKSIPPSIFSKAIEILETKWEDLDEECISYDILIDQLSTLTPGKFIEEWYKIKIKYVTSAHMVDTLREQSLQPDQINPIWRRQDTYG